VRLTWKRFFHCFFSTNLIWQTLSRACLMNRSVTPKLFSHSLHA
jgi:hypothetical protein